MKKQSAKKMSFVLICGRMLSVIIPYSLDGFGESCHLRKQEPSAFVNRKQLLQDFMFKEQEKKRRQVMSPLGRQGHAHGF